MGDVRYNIIIQDSLMMTSVHRLDKFNSLQCDVLRKLSACMGARALWLLGSLKLVPVFLVALMNFKLSTRMGVLRCSRLMSGTLIGHEGRGLSLLGYV